MKRNPIHAALAMLLGIIIGLPLASIAQDWFTATGVPEIRSLMQSADLRNEFASIETGISDKLPTMTGNGSEIVVVNSGGTALETADGTSISSGTFEATWDVACTTTPSQTWHYYQVGDIVTLYADEGFSCTSDTIKMEATTVVPAALRPTSGFRLFFGLRVVNSGSVDPPACLKIDSDGDMKIFRTVSDNPCGTDNFTASGAKGWATGSQNANSFTYGIF